LPRRTGFKVLHTCKDADCGEAGNFERDPMQFYDAGYLRRYLAAKLS